MPLISSYLCFCSPLSTNIVQEPYQTGIGISLWSIVGHICVRFQICPTILITFSGSPGETWQRGEDDDKRFLEGYLRVPVSLGKDKGRDKEVEEEYR